MAKTAEQRQEQKNEIQRVNSFEASNIAPIPAVKDPERRASCRYDLKLFCKTYFPTTFTQEFSEDHLKIIAIIEDAILNGGQAAIAMARSFGKTTLCRIACVWAILYGHRRYVVLVAATDKLAKKLAKNLGRNIEFNETLAEDFPEVCYPIRCLKGKTQRCQSQHVNGERTLMAWTAEQLILPTIAGSAASGATIAVAGLTGSIRGIQRVNETTGETMRPDFVMLDDVQTRESAFSRQQTQERLDLIHSDVMGLGGETKISAVLTCTVIASDDLAERILDRDRYPEWQGVKTKMMVAMPEDHKAWEAYAEVKAQAHRDHPGDSKRVAAILADYYELHRSELEQGARPSWPARFFRDDGEVSAIQHAMHKKLADELAFSAECQNEPIIDTSADSISVTPNDVFAKIDPALERAELPHDTAAVTAFIDVQGSLLYWMVVAFNADFRAHITDYGCYPKQDRKYFTLRDVAHTLADVGPKNADLQGQIYDGLDKLTRDLAGRTYSTKDSKPFHISRIVVDSGNETQLIRHFYKQIPAGDSRRAIVALSKGFGVTAKKLPINDWKTEPGIISGWNWRHKIADNELQFDTNSYKTFVTLRLLAALGDLGTLTLFNGTHLTHQLLAEHLSAERGTKVEALEYGRTIFEWDNTLRRENHWFDCLIGAFVAASRQGVVAIGHKKVAPQRKLVKKLRKKLNVRF